MPPEAPVISAMGRVGDAAGDEALNVAAGGNGLTFFGVDNFKIHSSLRNTDKRNRPFRCLI